jgi:uncharacterized protein (DUF433 family)
LLKSVGPQAGNFYTEGLPQHMIVRAHEELVMTLLERLSALPAPLRLDEAGVLRVGQTRVRLDTVIGAFNAGSSAEEILLKYPSLDLTEIYAVITYYLWHRTEVDAYLADREEASRVARDEAEIRFPREGVRERLLARH